MATKKSSSTAVRDIIQRYFPSATAAQISDSDIPHLSRTIYPETHYTDNEKVEIAQWLTTSDRLVARDEDGAKHSERLGSLNIHLSTRTTLLGSKPSIADAILYARLSPTVQAWSPEERTGERGYRHIVRYIDFVQNAPIFGLQIWQDDKVKIDPTDVLFVHKPLDPKEEKERKKKEKALANGNTNIVTEQQLSLVAGQGKLQEGSTSDGMALTGTEKANTKTPTVESAAPHQSKKEKKEKAPKQPKAVAPITPLSPCLIDLRVGHILKAIPHPNADSLYVSTIACGDPEGTDNTSMHDGQVCRTVCSGLNGLVPLEDMQNRKIVAVCNLKPVTMRGVKSAAMVLAASPRLAEGEVDNHTGPVELVNPPESAKAGARVYFDGWNGEPEGVLNPKKKIWETLQPGFTTTEDLGVAFDAGAVEQLGKTGLGKLMVEGAGECKVLSLQGAVVR
ncbi:G4 quadruplex nucleic acid binding protein [Ptychographa xylographoides]|nr:G4 quadruplex nucleic acid binding protein [Ptychographa xylographoides]